jgi:hypothetical protein
MSNPDISKNPEITLKSSPQIVDSEKLEIVRKNLNKAYSESMSQLKSEIDDRLRRSTDTNSKGEVFSTK